MISIKKIKQVNKIFFYLLLALGACENSSNPIKVKETPILETVPTQVVDMGMIRFELPANINIAIKDFWRSGASFILYQNHAAHDKKVAYSEQEAYKELYGVKDSKIRFGGQMTDYPLPYLHSIEVGYYFSRDKPYSFYEDFNIIRYENVSGVRAKFCVGETFEPNEEMDYRIHEEKMNRGLRGVYFDSIPCMPRFEMVMRTKDCRNNYEDSVLISILRTIKFDPECIYQELGGIFVKKPPCIK